MLGQSTLMKRTIGLVLASLCASTMFATLAFYVAGKTTAFSYHTNDAFKKAAAISNVINRNSDSVLEDPFFSSILGESDVTSNGTYILNNSGDICFPTNHSQISEKSLSGINKAREELLDKATYEDENYFISFVDDNIKTNLLVIQFPVVINGTDYYLISVSSLSENTEVINSYVNILLLSTVAAALTMLIPVVIVVLRIIEPISNLNIVAKEYGKGTFTARADENCKGEVGELAQSFNLMADMLSRSINDLTLEKNRLQEIFNVITEGIVLFNEEGDITVSNDTMNGIFAKVPKKNLFTEKLHQIPFQEVWEDVANCISSKERVERLLEGPDYAYSVTLIPKFDTSGDVCVGATGFFRDISEEQKLERTRRDYVANISHELRTPLQTLRGLIEPLSDGMVKTDKDKKRYYDIILNETLRLSRLIDDMLELSKLQSRTLAFKMFPFDLNNLLSDLETKFQSVMSDSGISFRVSFNTGRLPTVMGNPDRVEQILVILLDNAKKYTASGGSITISTEFNELDNKVLISVIDTGQGIHEYDINHIFDRFFKADRARGKKGTGLGLAIAKELLTYMGEDIKVESEYGKGTTFVFTLKRAEASNVWL